MSNNTPQLNIIILDSHDFYRLVVGDISFFPTGFTAVNPTLEITPPGFPMKVVDFATASINIFDSDDLGITCTDDDSCMLAELPDGLWKIKYTIAPADQDGNHIEKTFLKVDQLRRKFSEAFLKNEFVECDGKFFEANLRMLNEIGFYIEGAISAGNQCNNKLAVNLYQKADKLLDRYLNINTNCNAK